MSSEPIQANFSDPKEWKIFSERHQGFLRLFHNLISAMNMAFVRDHSGSRLDLVILSLGRLCVEELMEILLLCGYGYGVAALKLVRGMYERAVTAAYLHKSPEELDNFINYGHIAQYKLLRQIQATMGGDVLSPEQTREIEEEYRLHKAEFLITDCKVCGTQRVNHSWSKLDFVSMAMQTPFGKLIVPAYYLPTKEIHSTIGALFTRFELSEEEGIIFTGEPQHEKADEALISAHNIILGLLELSRDHFHNQQLEQPLQRCLADFQTIWRREPSTTEAPSTQ